MFCRGKARPREALAFARASEVDKHTHEFGWRVEDSEYRNESSIGTTFRLHVASLGTCLSCSCGLGGPVSGPTPVTVSPSACIH
eukprot:5416512-Prymnesium_polylepis.1